MTKVLIIDDEVNLRETIAEMLSYTGYHVCIAKDGIEGLTKVVEFQPNIIICDVMMPELDGYGFVEQHKSSKYAHVPVVLLTAKVEQKDEEYGLSLGVKAYIRKPFTFKDLQEKISLYANKV
jgi:CheY-like chemotaxis protein